MMKNNLMIVIEIVSILRITEVELLTKVRFVP